MQLVSQDGFRFELAVRGRGRSVSGEPATRLDWLDTLCTVEAPAGRWTFSSESIARFEADKLVDWLEAVSRHDDRKREIHFVEPHFSFELTDAGDDLVTVRMYFELRGRPPWSPEHAAGLKDIFVDLRLPRTTFARAAASLRADLEKVSSEATE